MHSTRKLVVFVLLNYSAHMLAMLRKTKIIATMGPAVEDPAILDQLVASGLNVARFNFSHGDKVYHGATIDRLREICAKRGRSVALLLDTKGPEIRTGLVEGDRPVILERGEHITVMHSDAPTTAAQVTVSYADIASQAWIGMRILIADGQMELEVVEKNGETLDCLVRTGGELGSKKNVNIPGLRTNLPPLTQKDEDDIAFAIEKGLDFIAASFIRKASDVIAIQKIIKAAKSGIKVIAKIEDEEGLDNIEEIIRVAHGVMIARGDLGVQIEGERLPLIQKRIIHKCNQAGKPVIVATQMLDSMIYNPRPTRAELTDVANAVMDGADAVMLSGETARGKYPVETVQTMDRIIREIESSKEYRAKLDFDFTQRPKSKSEISDEILRSALTLAQGVSAKALVSPTLSGHTARLLSSYRPAQDILAFCPDGSVLRQLLLNWGVTPIKSDIVDEAEDMIHNAIKAALDSGAVAMFDKLVLVAGLPLRSPVMINTLRVFFIGNILARGKKAFGTQCCGRIVKASTMEEAAILLRKEGGEILLVPQLDESYIPVLRCVEGVIVEGVSELPWEYLKLVNDSLVYISEVAGATALLENGITVSLDGREKIIYEGVVSQDKQEGALGTL